MNKKIVLIFVFSLLIAKIFSITIYTIGDSTMANRKPGSVEQGWGTFLQQFFKDSTIIVENYAVAGRSTKSFIDENKWENVKSLLKPGDYVFIQFGHNDQKADQVKLYANSDSAYRENLTLFIRETQKKGAFPVLLTSVVRRQFDENGILLNSLGRYPDVVRDLAVSLNIPMIDMEKKSRQLIEQLGVDQSKSFYMVSAGKSKDNTHFTRKGALAIAKLAVEGINESELPVAEYLIHMK
ncbi:MAG: rhamnogalacturonan acetylesterase [Paludibacter sp.]|nr:rhamnogalacturonan acetylesterase [Paludibacter sp.]